MAIPEELFLVLIPALAGIALHVAVRFFAESHRIRPRLDLLTQDRMRRIETSLLTEMENDVQRSLAPMAPGDPMGIDYPVRRRSREASELTHSAWDLANEHARLSQEYLSLAKWEDRGQMVCAGGTFINLLLVPILTILIVAKPLPVVVPTFYVWLAFAALVLPTLAAAYCYFAGYRSKRSLREGIDRHLHLHATTRDHP